MTKLNPQKDLEIEFNDQQDTGSVKDKSATFPKKESFVSSEVSK
jgi:hypothetical protein